MKGNHFFLWWGVKDKEELRAEKGENFLILDGAHMELGENDGPHFPWPKIVVVAGM